jgi:hypothetical protein
MVESSKLRTFGQIVALEPSFPCPSPFGGHDFASLQTWIEERSGSRFACEVVDARCWRVELVVHGRSWAKLIDWTDVESHECPVFEALLELTGDVEAYERGELTFGSTRDPEPAPAARATRRRRLTPRR